MQHRYCNNPTTNNGGLQCEREDGNRSSFEVKEDVCNENINCSGNIFEHLNFIYISIVVYINLYNYKSILQ